MKNLSELYKDLETYKDFDVNGNVDAFLEIIQEIIKKKKKSLFLF